MSGKQARIGIALGDDHAAESSGDAANNAPCRNSCRRCSPLPSRSLQRRKETRARSRAPQLILGSRRAPYSETLTR